MENIDAYYDQNTHGYMRYDDGAFADFVFDAMVQVMGDDYKDFGTAVELGAGMGRFSFALVSRFRSAVLVEPSRAFAGSLRGLFPQEHVQITNRTADEFFASARIEPGSIFFSFHLLHHLSRQQRAAFFSRIAETGSPAVFVEPNPWNPLLPVQIFSQKNMVIKEEAQYLTLTRRRLSRELSASGLQVRAHAPLCLLPPFAAKRVLKLRDSEKKLLRLERALRLLPFLGSYHFFYCGPGARPAQQNSRQDGTTT